MNGIQHGGGFMTGDDRDRMSAYLGTGQALFGDDPPPQSILAEPVACHAWVGSLLDGVDRWQLVGPDAFTRKLQSMRERANAVDLGDLAHALSEPAFHYYLPGLLLHFLAAGDYQESIYGPNFYFNVVRRLHDVASSLSPQQRAYVCALAKAIYAEHGDLYEGSVALGYEIRGSGAAIDRGVHFEVLRLRKCCPG
jgi:hypothetical protein